MSLISLLIFIPLQIAFVPLAIVGMVLVGYRQIVVSKRLGLSQTAIEIINGRWTMHVFGIRNDQASAQLAATLPNTSTLGLWFALFPLWVKFKICGNLFLYPRVPEPGSESIADFVVARTLYFDAVIERAIGEVQQFVVMGGGYDVRAYAHTRPDLVCFEVDQPVVQKHKLAMLAAAGIDAGTTRFVEVDFSTENVISKLESEGFSKEKRTLFLWEGVTLYLSEANVRKTMQNLREATPPGSILLADIYGERMMKLGRRSQQVLEQTGEALTFGLAFSGDYEGELNAFVSSEGFDPGETFFLGKDDAAGPYMAVVEMLRN